MGRLQEKSCSNGALLAVFVVFAACGFVQVLGATISCTSTSSPCFLKRMDCPAECPTTLPSNPTATKVCDVNCNSPICKPHCRKRKPNCNAPGAACLDPRFVGGDGIVFYFHGKSNQHFSLVSDLNLQINSRFIGLRPAGRTRDFTWIQALGLLFGSESFSILATRATTWDPETDHLKFTYNGAELVIPEGLLSAWESPEGSIRVERTSDKNSATITIRSIAGISVNVVPVTKEDDRIHNYRLPSDDCFAHLEVQFRFHSLSPEVDGILGRTYRPDFDNPAKPGVAMPVVGGEDKFRTSSLLAADCATCIFSPVQATLSQQGLAAAEYGTLACTSSATSGNGIICRR